MVIEEDFKLDFSSVLIRPKRSTLKSRKEVDLFRTTIFRNSKEEYIGIPIMAANMDGVGTFEIADALGDKLYILCGTILAHGLQDKIVEVFDEIQRSNMSKLSLDGTPVIREDGKILKGPNYFKPNIKSILEK